MRWLNGPAIYLGVFLLTLCFPAWANPSFSRSLTRSPQEKPAAKPNTEALKKYLGRYELESGIIPISTLDVTLENNELWIKPSVLKKRRMLKKSKTVFLDEIAGTSYTFNQDADGKIVSLTFEYESEHYTAPRIILPPPSLKGNTTFRLQGYETANVVALAGSFNNWNQSQFVFGPEGDDWVCRIELEPGAYTYKFIVDGNWILDPANPNTQDDDYGVKNSVVIVSKAPQSEIPKLLNVPDTTGLPCGASCWAAIKEEMEGVAMPRACPVESHAGC